MYLGHTQNSFACVQAEREKMTNANPIIETRQNDTAAYPDSSNGCISTSERLITAIKNAFLDYENDHPGTIKDLGITTGIGFSLTFIADCLVVLLRK